MASTDLPPAPESIQVAPPIPLKADPTPKFKIVEERSSLPAPVVLEEPRVDIPAIIEGLFPAGQVNLLSGASGAGKTAFTFSFLKSMHTGKDFFGIPAPRKPAFIGYLAADRTWKDHEQWLKKVQLESLPYYSLVGDKTITGRTIRRHKDVDRFDLFKRSIAIMLMREGIAPPGVSTNTALQSLPKDSFIVIDPISLFLGGDLNKYDLVYSHMLDLNQFCEANQCTILAIAHSGKQKSGSDEQYARPQDRINGTTAQTGCAATAMHLAPPTETKKPSLGVYEFTMVPHQAAAKTLFMKRDALGLFIPSDVIPDGIPDEPTSSFDLTPEQVGKMNKAKETYDKILTYMVEEETSTIEIIEKAALPIVLGGLACKKSLVYKYLGVMKSEGFIAVGSKEGMWKKKKQN